MPQSLQELQSASFGQSSLLYCHEACLVEFIKLTHEEVPPSISSVLFATRPLTDSIDILQRSRRVMNSGPFPYLPKM